jgi:acyl-CoA thioesterase-1
MRFFILTALAVASCACSTPHEDSRDTQPSPAAGAPAAPSKAIASPDSPAAPAVPLANDHRRVLVVFGDSISAGYGLEPGQSFPDVMQRRFDAAGEPWRVVNLGISGDTTEGGAARIDSATSLHPQIVILELGGNDGLRGLPLADTRANLERMILAFQHAGARVVLAGMTLPPNYGPDYIHGFEKVYRDLAAKYKLTLIPFLLQDIITTDLRYLQRDGIHPTAEGAEMVAGSVLRTIKPLLAAGR